MKTLLCVLFLLLATPSTAQAPSPNSISFGELGITVRLTLGMPKQAVLRTLQDSFGLTDLESENFSIHSKTNADLAYGSVSFRDGKLWSATKYWDLNGPDTGVAAVRAIYGAISSFGGSTRSCGVTTFDDQDPTIEKKGIVVSCGRRQLQVFTNRWSFKTGSGESAVVTEMLTSQE